jgi:6-phosphogluconolactonase
MIGELAVLPTADAMAEEAARRFVAAARMAVAERGAFVVALSGGATPKRLYERLAVAPHAPNVDWARVTVVWSDERCVPPDNPASNFRMARETLLDHVPILATNVRRIRGEYSSAGAAASYDELLHQLFGRPESAAPAHMDLVLLGLGEDGHTASLFPGETAVHESARWVSAAIAPAVPSARVTLTPVMINAAASVLFLVSGAAKSAIMQRVLEGPRTPHELPAQLITPVSGQLCWLVDAAAAAGLNGGTAQ